jgi:hypothetical protein
VQVGIPVLLVYMFIYGLLIVTGLQTLKVSSGKKKRLAMAVVLLKIGMFIPLFTSYIDSFNYITYTINFLSGLMINMVMSKPINAAKQARVKELTLSK